MPYRPRKKRRDKDYLSLAAKAVKSRLPDNHGFILLTFPFGKSKDNRLVYTSSASRETSIQVVKAWLFHQGEKEDWMEHIK